MKKAIPIVVVLLLLAAAGYAIYYFTAGAGNAATSALGGSGTIEAEQTIVTPQINGKIVSAPFAEGDSIKKGAVLYKLDPKLPVDQVKQAQAGVGAAAAQLQQVKEDGDSTDADVAAAEAQLRQAQIALDMARTTAGYTNVFAPIAGVVTNKVADVGENAAPGGTLAVLSDVSRLTVTIYISETDIAQVKIGDKATVTVDSTDVKFPGKVVFIASQAEFTPASVETKDQRAKLVYQVKLSVDNKSGLLKPGMPADVTF